MATYALLSILTILLFSMAANAGIVEDVCKDAANSEDGVNYDFCVTSLQPEPGATAADKPGLAKIVTQMAIRNATSTKGKFYNMVTRGGTPTDVKAAAETCSTLYKDDIRVMTEAMAPIKAGHYAEAVPQLNSTRDDPLACNLNFHSIGKPNPFVDEGNNLIGLVLIALRIISTLA